MPDVIKEAEKIVHPKLPLNILTKIKNMKAEVQKADTILKVYMAGIMDTMGLEGEYRLDENTGEIMPIPKVKE